MKCLDCKFFHDGMKDPEPRYDGWCQITFPYHIPVTNTNNVGRTYGCDLGQAIPMQMPKSSIIEKIIERKTSEGRGT